MPAKKAVKKKATKKKKSAIKRLGEAQTKAMSARPGAYQTHKGGPIMMRGEGWVDDPIRHAADKISKYLRSSKKGKK